MTKKTNLYCFALFIVILIFSSMTKASALTPHYDYKMQTGVGNTLYYVSPSATYWTRLINDAAHNWMYTGYGTNPIYMYQVTSKSGSHIDFYAYPVSHWNSDPPYASTKRLKYDGSTLYVPPNQDWFYSEISINDTEFRKTSMSDTVATGIIKHEIGHAFGMTHWPINTLNKCIELNSILCELRYGRTVQNVMWIDHQTINHIYP